MAPVIETPVAEDLIAVQNQGVIVNTPRLTIAAGTVSPVQNIVISQNLAFRIEAISATIVPTPAVDYCEFDIILPDQRHFASNVEYSALRVLGHGGLPLPAPGGGWIIPALKVVQLYIRNIYTESVIVQMHFHCCRYDAARLVKEGYLG
jgi:hypothetical protein